MLPWYLVRQEMCHTVVFDVSYGFKNGIIVFRGMLNV